MVKGRLCIGPSVELNTYFERRVEALAWLSTDECKGTVAGIFVLLATAILFWMLPRTYV